LKNEITTMDKPTNHQFLEFYLRGVGEVLVNGLALATLVMLYPLLMIILLFRI